MLNVRLLIIIIIFLPLTLALIGCGGHQTEDTSVGLPTETAKKLELIFNEEFNSIVVMDPNNRKTARLERTDKNENGEFLYTTRRDPGPTPVSKVENVTSYFVFGVETNNTNYSFCNIIKIDGQQEQLVCKKNQETGSRSTEEASDVSTKLASYKDNISIELAEELSRLGGEKINKVGFVIIFGLKSNKYILRVVEGYQAWPASASLLDSITLIKEGVVNVGVIKYKKNPCCTTEVINGKETEICQIICF